MWKNKKNILFFTAMITAFLISSSSISVNVTQSKPIDDMTQENCINIEKKEEKARETEEESCPLCSEKKDEINTILEQYNLYSGVVDPATLCAIACGIIFIICLLSTGWNLVKCNQVGAVCIMSCL